MTPATHSGEHDTPGYDQLLEQVLQIAPRVGAALSRAHGNRARELDRYVNADALSTHFPGGYIVGLDEIFSVLTVMTDAYQRSVLLKDIAFLIARVHADFESAIDAALSGFNGVVLDTMRDVMEVEYLFEDFLRDGQHITEWVGADRATLLSTFNPASLRRRQAAAAGTAPENLPDAFEYRLHSEGLHVSPNFILDDLAGNGFTAAPFPRALEFAFAEMFEHARRVILAAYDLGERVAGDRWTVPDVRTGMPEAARAWERTQAVMAVVARCKHLTDADTST